MSKGLLSVITPTYNTAKEYILSCANSLLTQPYRNFEWILVDDGSVDECRSFIKEVCSQDPRFHLVCMDHKGVSAARNAGIEVASGDYLTFIDSDDIVVAAFFTNAIGLLDRHDADIVIGRLVEVYDDEIVDEHPEVTVHPFEAVLDGERLESFRRFLRASRPLRGDRYPGINANTIAPRVYRAEAIRDVRFNTKMRVAEDHLFGCIAADSARRIVLTGEVWYKYVHHLRNTTSGITEAQAMKNIEGMGSLIEEGAIRGWCDSDVAMRCILEIRNTLLSTSIDFGQRRMRQFLDTVMEGQMGDMRRTVNLRDYDLSYRAALLVLLLSRGLNFLASALLQIKKNKDNY